MSPSSVSPHITQIAEPALTCPHLEGGLSSLLPGSALWYFPGKAQDLCTALLTAAAGERQGQHSFSNGSRARSAT